MSVRDISPIRKYTYEYTKRTPLPRKYRCYTSWYPHGSHVCSESRQCDKTRSLSRTCSRRVCLSSFVYTFVGSVVSLAAGGILFLPFSFALPPSSPPFPSALRYPTDAAELSSLLRSLRKLRLPPTIAVRRVSNEFGGARIVSSVHPCCARAFGKRETTRPVSLFHTRLAPADPCPPPSTSTNGDSVASLHDRDLPRRTADSPVAIVLLETRSGALMRLSSPGVRPDIFGYLSD